MDRPKPVKHPSRQRSKLTNGSTLLPGVDNRSAWARRLKDVVTLLTADLGDDADLSEAQRSLIRRAAALTCELERMESQFAEAGSATPDDLDLYARTSGNLRRLFDALGLSRAVADRPRLPTDATAASEYDLARRVAFALSMAARAGSPIIDLEPIHD